MKLLAQMNHTFSGRANAEQAKLLLEGYAVHDWVSHNSREFRALASNKQNSFTTLENISECGRETAFAFARFDQVPRGVCE
jgi:hypothetical protein